MSLPEYEADSPNTPTVGQSLRDWIKTYLDSRIQNAALVDDLAQEVLLRVMAQAHTLRNAQAFAGWVRRIALNLAADHFRNSPSQTEWRDDLAQPEGQASSPETLINEEARLRAELHNFINNAIEALPPKYREALKLTEHEGLSQVEVAGILGISVTAAKSRVQRARAQLRRDLERCCRFETDCYGHVVDVIPRPGGRRKR